MVLEVDPGLPHACVYAILTFAVLRMYICTHTNASVLKIL